MDGHPGGGPRKAGRGPAARADDRGAARHVRRRRHPQDAVEALRRDARRVGADAVSRPGHHVHLVTGRLRHELPLLRDGAGGPGPEPVDRRDRAPDRGRHEVAARRRGPGRGGPAVEHRLHGHGRAAGQLQAGRRRHPPAHRPRARRPGPVAARHHRLHGGPGAGDVPLRRRGLQVPPGGVAARPGRRAARHPGAGQHPLEGPRGAGRRLALRRGLRAPDLRGVRADPRRERPGVAGRPAGQAAEEPPRARQPDPAQPDAGLEVDGVQAAGRAGLRGRARGARCAGDGTGHPRPGDRRRLRAARGSRALTCCYRTVGDRRQTYRRTVVQQNISDRGAPETALRVRRGI
ncbi:hypothetical protein SBRY_11268 [Actinacidiphila bryophytorum]|uniref:Uncharacterized protein n=1 Tax=Actinacidiphila bryophytorum TaxID=1436133 RepID=A0A9W4GWT2_9ACTN|nr:hypothetical protein SBRY_11268 [Actinacidiphila bryophytorum]